MATMAEQMRAAMQQSKLVWRPQAEGEIIEGTVTEIGKTITENGEREFLKMQTEGGEKMVFLNRSLKKLVSKNMVDEGDRIAIGYVGQVVGTGAHEGKTFKNYMLLKEGGQAGNAEDDD